MKRTATILSIIIGFMLLSPCAFADRTFPLIIDHNHTDITRIAQSALEQAKSSLHIAYGHTSHGSQVTSGMTGLVGFANNGGLGLSLPHNIFAFNNGGTDGALDLEEGSGYNQGWMDHDCGYYPNWVDKTRAYLDDSSHDDVNVIIWSWCGQVTSKYTNNTLYSEYLEPMAQLEIEYPEVMFVYMTGHVDIINGGQVDFELDANNKAANKVIRDYCIANNKILYDFADIERYNPDGEYFEFVRDNCNYYKYPEGTQLGNWATEWQNSHTERVDWYNCDSAHSQALNANRKAYAAWWLWARLAGWGECIEAPSELSAQANLEVPQIELSWTHNATGTGADSFIIQRQVNDEPWVNDYASVAGDLTNYTDTDITVGTYRYRVAAHLNDGGQGNPCDSGSSNTVTVQVISTDPPAAPSDLAASPDSQNRRIRLTWTDNAANESGYRIQRQRGSDAWEPNYAEVGEDESEFTDSQLEPGEYAYRVLAFNDNGNSAATDPAAATILDLPDTPGGLTAQADPGNGTITLSWTHAGDNEAGFIIQRRVDDGAWVDPYDQTLADVLTYNDTNLGQGPLADGTYTYRVVAFNDDGQSNPSTEAVAVMTSDDDPDSDGDGTPDSEDGCPYDSDKTAPGTCGCGKPETDSDDDGTPDCEDLCPQDPDKIDPGQCGCGVPETDTCNSKPLQPVLVDPDNTSTDISLSPSMSTGQFQDPDSGDTHGQTIWQISTTDDFSELVYNETSDAHLTAFAVSEPLEAQTTYYWRVCYIDNRGAQSEWSEPFSFTTAAPDQSPDQPPEDNDDNNNDDGSNSDDAFGCFIGEAAQSL